MHVLDLRVNPVAPEERVPVISQSFRQLVLYVVDLSAPMHELLPGGGSPFYGVQYALQTTIDRVQRNRKSPNATLGFISYDGYTQGTSNLIDFAEMPDSDDEYIIRMIPFEVADPKSHLQSALVFAEAKVRAFMEESSTLPASASIIVVSPGASREERVMNPHSVAAVRRLKGSRVELYGLRLTGIEDGDAKPSGFDTLFGPGKVVLTPIGDLKDQLLKVTGKALQWGNALALARGPETTL